MNLVNLDSTKKRLTISYFRLGPDIVSNPKMTFQLFNFLTTNYIF